MGPRCEAGTGGCALLGAIPPTLDTALIAAGFSVSPASTPSSFGQKFLPPFYMNTCIGFV